MDAFSTRMFSNRMLEINPVVFELDLMRAPFCVLRITELVKEMLVTLLSILVSLGYSASCLGECILDFPPTEPMERPWLPLQYMLLTKMLLPLVTATQSSWLRTTLSRIFVSLVVPKSKPRRDKVVSGVHDHLVIKIKHTIAVVGSCQAVRA
jgi:hypothetical protein